MQLLAVKKQQYQPEPAALSDEQALADEQTLVGRARSGDKQAFEALYRQHVPRVYGLCLRLTSNPADADDATQDTFIKAWERLDSFRGVSAFGTWLHRIAVNESLGRQRKKGRELQHLQLMEPGKSTTAGPDGQLEELEQAIGRLPAGARNVFVLLAVYGYSHEEAAKMLDIAAGTSKAQLHRARKLLAGHLADDQLDEKENRLAYGEKNGNTGDQE